MSKSLFLAALEREAPLVLDGGLATQIEAQGFDIGNELWSASLLLDNPQAIVDGNRAFLEAGAECIATASYQASHEGLARCGLSVDEADELMMRSVELAIRARDGYLAAHPDAPFVPLVAASIGPYGAMLHDGSEYRGDYGVAEATLRAFHASRLRLFDASQADVLAFETVPCLPEARVMSELLLDCATPAWVSFSCPDGRVISDGTPIEEAVGVFRDHPVVVAVGFNCTPPQYAVELIRRIRAAVPNKHVIAYPNSGETFDVTSNSWSGTSSPLDYAQASCAWRAAGAKIVGGCCRTSPDHIREIRRAFS